MNSVSMTFLIFVNLNDTIFLKNDRIWKSQLEISALRQPYVLNTVRCNLLYSNRQDF